ncbi:MAG TPA: hypothetical protein VFT22_31795 [Kofleriaceae bacterium]|nr:hypothetical protein [Kofleriaceae bacterium]
MVNPRALVWLAWLAVAGCGSFQDPNVVLDLRVLALAATPPDQVIDVDLTRPPDPQALLAELVPTTVCALVADPGLDRRLLWSMTMCPASGSERCAGDDGVLLGTGLADDPDTATPEPQMCVTIAPDPRLLTVLTSELQGDDLHGLGGVDYHVILRIGGEDADRELDQYAFKTLRVSPRIPETHAANTNPTLTRIDTAIDDATPVALPLVRCADNPSPPPVAPGTKLRMTPVEPDGAREVYVVPTLDGKSQTFTESLTYQWIASDGGFSAGSTGGPRDLAGNPAPLFTDYKAPSAGDLDGPTNVSVWIIQRDERLGVTWYEACLRVAP